VKYKIHRKHLIASSFLALSLAVILGFQNCAKKGLKTSQVSSTSMASSSGSGDSSNGSNLDTNDLNNSGYSTSGGTTTGTGATAGNNGGLTTTTTPGNQESCSIAVVGKEASNGIYDYRVGESLNIQVKIKPELQSRVTSMFLLGTRNKNIRDAFGGDKTEGFGDLDKEPRFVSGVASSGSVFTYENGNGELAGLYSRAAVFRDSSGAEVCRSKEVKARFLNKYLGTKACFVVTNLDGNRIQAKLDNMFIYKKYDVYVPESGLRIFFTVVSIDESGTQKEELTSRTLWRFTAVGGSISSFGYHEVLGEDPSTVPVDQFSSKKLAPYVNMGWYSYVKFPSPVTYTEWATVFDDAGNYVCRTVPFEMSMHSN
jgi:uncharacterized protein affecting Mg2+/Co2+ transport